VATRKVVRTRRTAATPPRPAKGRARPARGQPEAEPADRGPAIKPKAAGPAVKPKAAGRAVKPKAAGRAAPAAGRNGKSLVVVESPAKAKTLGKFLGRGFTVMASYGHVRDLPKSELGVDPEHDFEPKYVPIRGKAKVVAALKEKAKAMDRIYLAPDPDREGEAIAWHLASYLKGDRRRLMRLTFNEITERAVKAALENPRELDMNLVNAQQARRVLDRLVGYQVSPFVWRTVRYGLSAGRVQTVALRLVCEREDEILAFVPEEYWTVEVDYLSEGGERFTAKLAKVGERELEGGHLANGEEARALAAELLQQPARVSSISSQARRRNPPPPFITSTLQQAAFNRLRFTSQRTMAIAQELYEGLAIGDQGSVGLITYMRTDSPRTAGEAIAEMREFIPERLGEDYLPDSPRQFKSKGGAQDAHEAIRPTSIRYTPETVRPYLNNDQFKLYELIWQRALASQTREAEFMATTIEVESGRLGLKATGNILVFAGFLKIYGADEEDDERESRLPAVSVGQDLRVAPPLPPEETAPAAEKAEPIPAVRPEQHFTEPPPRYTEATLVRTLEEQGIGRPSTYATIVTTITSREYVEREKGRLMPTDLGMKVSKMLVEAFPDVFEVEFTRRMEEELDEIEEGRQEWHQVVRDFYGPFSRDLAEAEKKREQHRKSIEESTDITCPQCGSKLVKKFGRRGPFLACPKYPECKYTRPVDDAELPTPVEGKCPDCGAGLVARTGRYGRFIACERYPECKHTRPFSLGIACPQCGQGEIVEKRSRRGKTFFGCNRYPACDFALWDRPVAQACPSCGAPFMVEKTTKQGKTLRCVKCKTQLQPEAVGGE
jgi:DNA topoisomerase-1